MKKDSKLKLSLRSKRGLTGYLFISPFIIGFILFFLYPFIQSVIFSLNKLEITQSGFVLEYVGLENFREAVLVHPNFARILIEGILGMINDIPLILIFSFFIANLLNQEFRGRFLARTIFFLPVILTAKIIYNLEQGSYIQQALNIQQVSNIGGIISTRALQSFLYSLKFPYNFVNYIGYAINRLPDIINSSAIPVLIFLAALQSIPNSIYEAAYIEGATKWESFWKITFPLISSFILVNIVYIFVDAFTTPQNRIVALLKEEAWGGAGYGVSTAMAWIYFLAIAALLGLIVGIISRYIYQQQH